MNSFVSFNDFKNGLTKLNASENKNINTTINKPVLLENKDTVKIGSSSRAKEKLELAKRQNGLIEKLADKIKSLTNIGFSSKKIEESIKQNKDEKEIEEDIKNYRRSQENVAQATGDVASCSASMGVFFGIKQFIEKSVAQHFKINNTLEKIKNEDEISKNAPKYITKFKKFIVKHVDKRYSAILLALIPAIITGGFVKKNLLKLNRIGTQQYKPQIDETISEEKKDILKTEAKSERKNANRRNARTGRLNALMLPIISTLGVAGVPLYLIGNSLSRYFVGTKEDAGNKSFAGYINNLKSSVITHVVSALAIAFPAIKKGKFNKVFEKNLDEVVEQLNKIELKKAEETITTYQKLDEIILGSPKISDILNANDLTVAEKIQKISEENIFALKFKQIGSNDDEVARALKMDCPPTRTVQEAEALIKNAFGNEYSVKSCVGVGTVAETYLVEDSKGVQTCVKMLKDGITSKKITSDRDNFIKLIENATDKTQEEKDFLIKNVENIANGVLQEVDFNNEMKAAQELAKVTKKAKVVVPIKVKNGMYMMQKADGISLSELNKVSSLQDKLCSAKFNLEFYKQRAQKKGTDDFSKNISEYQKKVEEINQQIIEARKNIPELTSAEFKKLLETYQDVLVEQFSKVDKGGKIIHGDIHPGNIFIDIDALKRGDKKFFTLIDTGNTIKQSQASALRFLNLSNYIKNADLENITEFVLNGATLPSGMTKEVAKEKIMKELSELFFNDKNTTYTGYVSNDNILAFTDNIMQKLNIIPADTQGNLMKSKTSAIGSMEEFVKGYMKQKTKEFQNEVQDILSQSDEKKMNIELGRKGVAALAEMTTTMAKYPLKQKIQEYLNLRHLSLADKLKIKISKSTPKKNSKEYLTYILKQYKNTDKIGNSASIANN